MVKALGVLCILFWAAWAQAKCQLFADPPFGPGYWVVRHGHHPVAGALGPTELPMTSLLDCSEPACRWFFYPTPNALDAFGRINGYQPDSERVKNLANELLRLVYRAYLEQGDRRPVFSGEFVQVLQAQDQRRLDEAFTMWGVYQKGKREPLLAFGTYNHTPNGSSDVLIEITRVAKSSEAPPELSLVQVLPLISEWLAVRQITSGKLVFDSDLVGARTFQALGGREVRRAGNPPLTVVGLEFDVAEFMARYPPPTEIIGPPMPRIIRLLGEPLAL